MKLGYKDLSKITVKLTNKKQINPITCVINVRRALGAILLPNMFVNSVSRAEKSYSKIDYNTEDALYYIEDQQYLGTVKSLSSDASVDLYLYKGLKDGEEYKVILIIPSLLVLGEADEIENYPMTNHEIDGMISMIELPSTGTSTVKVLEEEIEEHSGTSLKTVIDKYDMNTPDHMSVSILSLSSLSNGYGFAGFKTGDSINYASANTSQYIVLGDVKDIFDTTTNGAVSLSLHKLKPTSMFTYEYFKRVDFLEVVKGRLAIPLNF